MILSRFNPRWRMMRRRKAPLAFAVRLPDTRTTASLGSTVPSAYSLETVTVAPSVGAVSDRLTVGGDDAPPHPASKAEAMRPAKTAFRAFFRALIRITVQVSREE